MGCWRACRSDLEKKAALRLWCLVGAFLRFDLARRSMLWPVRRRAHEVARQSLTALHSGLCAKIMQSECPLLEKKEARISRKHSS